MKEYFLIKLLDAVVFRGKGVYFFEKFSQFFSGLYTPYRGNGGILYEQQVIEKIK